MCPWVWVGVCVSVSVSVSVSLGVGGRIYEKGSVRLQGVYAQAETISE